MRVRRLVDFPYVLVRLRCDACKRAGSYRLARLAVKFGAEILLDDLLVRLSADCPWRDDPRGNCGPRRPRGWSSLALGSRERRVGRSVTVMQNGPRARRQPLRKEA
jgi:hypothetical protein